jgi:hypothetical protein
LVVDRGVIRDHPLGEGSHIFVLRFFESLFARLNVDQSRGVSDMRDMRDLRVGWLGGRVGPKKPRAR